MQKIATKFDYRGFTYIQEKRQGNIAIYQQFGFGVFLAYEVVIIRQQKAGEFNGIKFEEKELYPSDNLWGVMGFTCKTARSSEIRFDKLLKAEKEKELFNA